MCRNCHQSLVPPVSSRGRTLLIVWAVGLTAILVTTSHANAASTKSPLTGLADALDPVARQIAADIRSRQQTTITIGAFRTSHRHPGGSGPGIARVLTNKLKALQINVEAPQNLGIQGKYLPGEIIENEVRRVSMTISMQLMDRDENVISTYQCNVTEHEEIARIAGVTVEFAGANQGGKQATLLKALNEPAAPIEKKQRVKAGPYAIEILVKQDDVYLPMELSPIAGNAFADIPRNAVYAVKLINNSRHDAAVRLGIDGLSMFALSSMNYTHVIVPKQSEVVVKGWHRNNGEANEFLVAPIENSLAAAVLSDPDATAGVISATFSAAWAQGELEPEDEDRDRGPDGDGTAVGEKTKTNFKEVLRHIGKPRAVISVHYSKQNTGDAR